MSEHLHEMVDPATIDSISKLIGAAATGIKIISGTVAPDNKRNSYSYSSTAKAASKLIAVYPVLVSRSVSSNTAQMVSKYIEQKGCIIIQLALQMMNISNAENGAEYLRQFHQNLNIGGDDVAAMGSIINAMITDIANLRDKNINIGESTIAGSLIKEKFNEFNFDGMFEHDNSIRISNQQMKELMEMFADAEKYQIYDTQLNERSINDFIVKESAGDYIVSIKTFNEANRLDKWIDDLASAKNKDKFDEWKRKKEIKERLEKEKREKERLEKEKRDEDYREERDRLSDIHRKKQDEYREERDRKQDEYRKERDRLSDEYREERDRKQDEYRKERDRLSDKYREERDRKQDEYRKERDRKLDNEKERLERIEQQSKIKNTAKTVEFLKNQDIKKMNSAVPSLIIVRFYNSSTASVATEFIIGVKSKVLAIDSIEVLRRIANDNRDGKSFLNFMRTATGEMKVTDFLFGLSRIKEDLKSTKVKGAYGDTWNLLQTRAAAAKTAIAKGKRNDFSAITTVVISRDDADDLYKEENIDITDPKIAKHFMESYNLLGFVIVDDALESAKFLFDDGNRNFEEFSYKMLARETEAETYKSMLKLMANNK